MNNRFDNLINDIRILGVNLGLKLLVNVYGASGVGKSILATHLTNQMKLRGVKAEYCREWIKELVLKGENICKIPQKEITINQAKLQDMYLNSGAEVVVTDSPLLLGKLYGRDDFSITDALLGGLQPDNVALVNILLVHDEKNVTYQEFGRVESFDESLSNQNILIDILNSRNVSYAKFTLGEALGVNKK